jgi:hypothetical protein
MAGRFRMRKIATRLRQELYRRERRQFIPANAMAEDIYLVSFPKSGNHWLRFLLANAIKAHYAMGREVNFFTIDDLIPNIHMVTGNLQTAGPFGRPELPRLIKSHCDYNPYYNRVVLLVRDPRDVLISYYHFLRDRQMIPQAWAISSFIRHPKHGAAAWATHTHSWCAHVKAGQHIQLFSYEAFLQDTPQQLDRLMRTLGLCLSDENLETAIKLSSKTAMRLSEGQHRSLTLSQSRHAPLVRQGEATQGKSLEEADRHYIEDTTRHAARLVGYDY